MTAWASADQSTAEPPFEMKTAPLMKQRPEQPAPLTSQPGGLAQGEDVRGFKASVLCHLDAAYTLALYLARRPDIAEDIVQDAMLRAYRAFHTCRGGNTRARLLAIVRNCFFTWKASVRDSEENDLPEDAEFVSESVF